MYQHLYDRPKKIIKKDACIEFYDASRPLYLETNASSVSLEAKLLQVRNGINCGCDEVSDNTTLHPVAFTSKSLFSAEWCYSNKEREALGILYSLEKFHHYCFAKEYA